MLLYSIRRYRRPLLFPPGLLALGFLLLLGCLALRPWYRQLKPQYFLQITMPPTPVSDFILPLSEQVERYEKLNGRAPNPKENLLRYSQLAHFRKWQDFAFTGVPRQDATTATKAQQAFVAMQADTRNAHGIRIRFGNQATYTSMIQTLDWASAATKKYLLDLHHEPVTLYALTYTYVPGMASLPTCGFMPYQPPPASFEVQMQNWLTRWQQAWQKAFTSLAWQLPILFLLGIIAVNCWKMARQWHTA